MKKIRLETPFGGICLVFLTLILSSNSWAQEGGKGRGYRGPLTREKMAAVFSNGGTVEGYVIEGRDLIQIIKETDHEIRITDSVIRGGLDFTDLQEVENRIDITNSRIGGMFRGRKSYSVDAEKTVFHEHLGFDKVIFDGDVILRQAKFSKEGLFGMATFHGEASFREATFRRGAYFRLATFNGRASFRGTTFTAEAYFRKAIFNHEAYFREATFRGRAYFRYATFARLATFKDSRFDDVLDVRFSRFKEYANFRNTEMRRLNFDNARSPTIVPGRIDFRRASISEAHFEDIIFEKDVDFSDVTFGDMGSRLNVVFRYITFEKDANFFRTEFHSDTTLENVTFKKNANFTEADFQNAERFSLSYVNFNNLVIRFRQFPRPDLWVNALGPGIENSERLKIGAGEKLQPLSQVLKHLEANFRNRGQLSDANEAYYQMKNAQLREERAQEPILRWLPGQSFWIVWGITCGYGTRILRILAWCVLFDLLFAIAYHFQGNLKRQPHPKTQKEFVFKQRLFDFPEHYLTRTVREKKRSIDFLYRFMGALRFSSVVLLKVGYRDTTVSGTIWGIDYKYIVWIEWLLGFYLLAALAVTLSNTVPVVNRLITGVF